MIQRLGISLDEAFEKSVHNIEMEEAHRQMVRNNLHSKINKPMQATTINELYPEILAKIMLEGDEYSPRGMKIREILGFEFRIDDITQPLVTNKERKLNYAYTTLEPYLLLFKQNSVTVETCCYYVGKFLRANVVNKETGMMDGWYGDRLNTDGLPRQLHQLVEVYNILKKDPDSRRAVVSIYDGGIDLRRKNSLDIPCTLNLQFLIRSGKLNMITNMRSNDAVLGTPQNVVMFSFFQRMLSEWLGLEYGWYLHRVGSAHIYERDFEKADKIINCPEYESQREFGGIGGSPDEAFENAERLIAHEKMIRQDPSSYDISEEHEEIQETLAEYIIPHILRRHSS